jgi:hypothetical protein
MYNSICIKGTRRITSVHIIRYANSEKMYPTDIPLDFRFHRDDYKEYSLLDGSQTATKSKKRCSKELSRMGVLKGQNPRPENSSLHWPNSPLEKMVPLPIVSLVAPI